MAICPDPGAVVTARLLGVWPDRSPEWLAAREGRIGGSDIGVILGWSPYKTRADLLADKLGQAEPRKQSKAQERGIYLEAGVRDWLLNTTGTRLDPDRSTGTWVDADDDRCAYNPDGVTECGRLVEIKTTTVRDQAHGWGRAGKTSDRIPLTYRAQVQWGMGLLELDECLVGVLSGQPRFEFAQYRVQFDPDAYAYLRQQADLFLAELASLQHEGEAA